MRLNTEAIKNKQRILITGNHGLTKITTLIRHILDSSKKPYCFISENEEIINESPIVIMKGGHDFENEKPLFHKFNPHIALIHKVSKTFPEQYKSFDHYIGEIEKMADNLPKAGSLIYNSLDDLTIIIGKKEREDVKPLEYGLLECSPVNVGFKVDSGEETFIVATDNENFPSHAAAARAFTKRIGISDQQFFTALKSL